MIKSKDKTLDLTTPQVMGILNVTPDSFSDGGHFLKFDHALKQVESMINDGASIIDIGGESTRPGAQLVTIEQELERVVPMIEAINSRFDCWISIDTSKAKVMTAAVSAGADLINDVRALQEPGALVAAALLNVPVCLMHMQGKPSSMQNSPEYDDIIVQINEFFKQRINACLQAGIQQAHIILDPGFGFGKTMVHNFKLIKHLKSFSKLGYPVLAGLSRKSMFDHLLSREPNQRLAASLAGAILCVQQGAKIIRVHDVKETVDVIKVLQATQ